MCIYNNKLEKERKKEIYLNYVYVCVWNVVCDVCVFVCVEGEVEGDKE